MGTLTVNRGAVVWGFVALNELPSAKLRLLAVLVRKEPPTFSEALGPKRMPLGLIRKKSAELLVPLV
jgi:hypothetical protein